MRSGTVKLTRHVNSSRTMVVRLRTAGDLFGYREVLAGLPSGISAETIEPSVICTIRREDFLRLVEECVGLRARRAPAKKKTDYQACPPAGRTWLT